MGGELVVLTPTQAEEHRASALANRFAALSRSDGLTLVCAQERRLVLLMEDRRAKNVAIVEGIDYVTLQVLPLYGLIDGQMSLSECQDWLGRIGRGMHSDPAIVAVMHAAAKEIEKLRNEEEGQ